MRSFISSLLIQLGIQSPHLPPPPTSQPHEAQIEPQLNEPTKALKSDNKDKAESVLQSGQGSGQELNCGDAGAGSLHSSLFFTTLPKEMDGRNLELEGTQSVVYNAPEPTQSMAATSDGLFNPTPETDTTGSLNTPESLRNPQDSNPNEADNSHNGSQSAYSAVGDEEPRLSLGNALDTDAPAQSPLPADDGMGVLRSKIIAIRELQLANVEKARMVHALMTEDYNSSRERLNTPGAVTASTPSSPRTPRASEIHASGPGSPDPELNSLYEKPFNLTTEDLQPTFVPKLETDLPDIEPCDEDLDTEEQEEATLGCVHYHRNVKLECHTCKKWYTCRFCHDEVEDHSLIRRDTEHMLCMLCGHAQPAAQSCRQCGEQTAQYYCDLCKLWDNDSKKSIYHCNDCGICRIGQGLGKDFFHCQVRILVILGNFLTLTIY